MDVLYYSNYCKHSQKLLQYLVKNGLSNKLNFICIDRRIRDPKTNGMFAVLDNGQYATIPPNIQSVPSLLLVHQKYSVLVGNGIYDYLNPLVQHQNKTATAENGEPIGYIISNNGGAVQSQYDMYNGQGGTDTSFAAASHDVSPIYAPPENYTSGKIKGSEGDTSLVDSLKQMREQDLQRIMPQQQQPLGLGGL